jgi:NADP-dependent 3-hydroxy acid dehydrogenase YdfG
MTQATTPAVGAARGLAVITGASSGIGAAAARRLAADGFHVVLVARRKDRIVGLAAELADLGWSASALTADVTIDADVAALRDAVAALPGPLTVVVNNAGGAVGADEIASARVADWQVMFDVNVLGTLRVTQALLPLLDASGAGTVVVLSSTAGLGVYEGGGGYAAAKHAQTAFAETLRLELCGRPIRVIEIDPGMVRTDEFAINRFGGDEQRAAKVYAGVLEPLVADDIADLISFAVTRPHHVNIDRLVVRPLAQAAQHKVHRV